MLNIACLIKYYALLAFLSKAVSLLSIAKHMVKSMVQNNMATTSYHKMTRYVWSPKFWAVFETLFIVRSWKSQVQSLEDHGRVLLCIFIFHFGSKSDCNENFVSWMMPPNKPMLSTFFENQQSYARCQ